MKAFMIKSACLFSAFAMVTLSSGISAQGTPAKTNVASATADYTKVTPTTRKGEVTRETDCIDLFVTKGCVKYSVTVPGENLKTPNVIQVCAQENATDAKKVDICRPGATKITVKYEKTEDGAVISFVPRKPNKKVQVNKEMQKQ